MSLFLTLDFVEEGKWGSLVNIHYLVESSLTKQVTLPRSSLALRSGCLLALVSFRTADEFAILDNSLAFQLNISADLDGCLRAQALDNKGNLIDDFLIKKTKNSLHIINAPSPAATASLAIADEVVGRIIIQE